MGKPSLEVEQQLLAEASEPFNVRNARINITIMDGYVWRCGGGYYDGLYKEIISGQWKVQWSAEVNASRNGVSLQGRFPTYQNKSDIFKIMQALAMAWNHHLQFKQTDSYGFVAGTAFTLEEMEYLDQCLQTALADEQQHQ